MILLQKAGHLPGAHLYPQLLFEDQSGAQITSPAHKQLIRAALQKTDGCAHLPQVPESGQRFDEISQTQGLVYHRGHRVDPRPAEQKGGPHVLVRLRVRVFGGRVDDVLGRLEVEAPLLGEERTLADMIEHVGHSGRPIVQTSVTVADVDGNLFQDFVDGGEDDRHDGLGALGREQRTFVVGERVCKAAGVFHHRRSQQHSSEATTETNVRLLAPDFQGNDAGIQSQLPSADWTSTVMPQSHNG